MADAGEAPAGRVFAALVPPPEIRLALAETVESWDVPGRPVPIANWHVTIRFVGRIDDVTWDRWRSELAGAALDGPLRIRLGGPGAFPKPQRATVVFVAVEALGIEVMAEAVEEATVAAGLDPEERPFHPHLTLARVRPPVDVRGLIQNQEPVGIAWTADQIHLMAGVGSRYRTFDTISLG